MYLADTKNHRKRRRQYIQDRSNFKWPYSISEMAAGATACSRCVPYGAHLLSESGEYTRAVGEPAYSGLRESNYIGVTSRSP